MNAIYLTIQALLAESDITDVVGQRIEFMTGPEAGTLPDIVINQITNLDGQRLSGADRYPSARIRIECRARTKTAAVDLGDIVIERLTDLRGTFAGMVVDSFIKEETDETDASEDYQTYRRFFDFSVRYRAA